MQPHILKECDGTGKPSVTQFSAFSLLFPNVVFIGSRLYMFFNPCVKSLFLLTFSFHLIFDFFLND